MNFSCMAPHEIRLRYRNATDKRAMIKVLSELTCSSKQEMREFLGLDKSGNPSDGAGYHEKEKFNEEKAKELYDAGAYDTIIARALNCNKSTVARWRIANDLKSNWGKDNEKKN